MVLNWENITSNIIGNIFSIGINSSKLFAAGSEGIFSSSLTPINWNHDFSGDRINNISLDNSENTTNMIAVGENGIYHSVDGSTWLKSADPTLNFRYVSLYSNYGIAAENSPTDNSVYTSDDTGKTWTKNSIKYDNNLKIVNIGISLNNNTPNYYVGTNIGLFYRQKLNSWTPYFENSDILSLFGHI